MISELLEGIESRHKRGGRLILPSMTRIALAD